MRNLARAPRNDHNERIVGSYRGFIDVARSKFKPLSARPVTRVALLGEGNAVKNRIDYFFCLCVEDNART